MAASESHSSHGCMASMPEDVPGGAKTFTSKVVDAGAGLLQSLKPIQNFKQHVCTWAIFSDDMGRKIEMHHYPARLNEDFLQCAVYNSDQSNARLIGENWGLVMDNNSKRDWINPGLLEVMQKQELKGLAKTYGKFWCTWQFD